MYDFVIIGSGISGMYFTHKILKKSPKCKLLVIEKNKEIGGRVGYYKMKKSNVSTGAGVARKDDKQFIQFYQEITQQDLSFFRETIDYSYVGGNEKVVTDTLRYLYKEAKKLSKTERSRLSFKTFAKRQLSSEQYNQFLLDNTYTDFEKADVIDTLEDYRFEDNMPNGLIAGVDWQLLLDKYYKKYKKYIMLNTTVSAVDSDGVTLSDRKRIQAKNIIIAVTVNQIDKLLQNALYFKGIASQPFIRYYVILNKELPLESGETLLDSPLKKIIPIQKKQTSYHLYLIAYADNEDALILKHKTDAYILKELKRIFDPEITKNLKILQSKKFYWEEGTHYYKPLSVEYNDRAEYLHKAQHPYKNIYVIGEMVSRNQGWVQGAAESAEKILTFF